MAQSIVTLITDELLLIHQGLYCKFGGEIGTVISVHCVSIFQAPELSDSNFVNEFSLCTEQHFYNVILEVMQERYMVGEKDQCLLHNALGRIRTSLILSENPKLGDQTIYGHILPDQPVRPLGWT
jgi:hypothetical protein